MFSSARRLPLLGLGITTTAIGAYEVWKKKTIEEQVRLATLLCSVGYVDVQGVAKKKKEKDWELIANALKETWKQHNFEGADPNDSSTWKGVSVASQRFTSLTKVEGVIELGRLAPVQMVYIALFDPEFVGKVHFGHETSWIVKLLISPLWLFHPRFEPKGSLVLQGGQGWKLPRFPPPDIQHAEPAAIYNNGWHTDQITCDELVRNGLVDPSTSPTRCMKEATLHMFTTMAGSLLYCATPGELNSRNGSTGIIPGAHLDALATIGKATACVTKGEKEEHMKMKPAELQTALNTMLPRFLPPEHRPTLPSDRIRLLTAVTPHTVTLPSEAMQDGHVRVVQNPKILSVHGSLSIHDISPNAPILALCSVVATKSTSVAH